MANTLSMEIMYRPYDLVEKDLKHSFVELRLAVNEIFQTPRVKFHKNVILPLIKLLSSIDCSKLDNEVMLNGLAYPFLPALVLLVVLHFFERIVLSVLDMPDFINFGELADMYGVIDFQGIGDVGRVILFDLRFVSFVGLLYHFVQLRYPLIVDIADPEQFGD